MPTPPFFFGQNTGQGPCRSGSWSKIKCCCDEYNIIINVKVVVVVMIMINSS